MADTNKFNLVGSLQLDSFLELQQIATPGSAISGFNRLYFKADGNLYMKNSAGTEAQVNGGGINSPGTSTDRAITTWNGTAGNTLRGDNSTVTISSTGFLSTSKNRIIIGSSANMGLSDTTMFANITSGTLNTGFGGGNALNNITSGTLNTSMGWGNLTQTVTGNNNSSFGVGNLTALTGGSNNIAIGYVVGGNITNGGSNILLGTNTGGGITTGSGNICMGSNAAVINVAQTGGTQSNQLVIGGPDDSGIKNAVIGNGWFSSTPNSVTLSCTGANVANTTGGTFTIRGGISTGTAVGGKLIFQTSPSTTSGNVFNTYVDALTVDGNANVLLGTASPATTATYGFPYAPVVNGTPTGVPVSVTGYAPFQVDSSGSKLWVYIGGSWKSTTLA